MCCFLETTSVNVNEISTWIPDGFILEPCEIGLTSLIGQVAIKLNVILFEQTHKQNTHVFALAYCFHTHKLNDTKVTKPMFVSLVSD